MRLKEGEGRGKNNVAGLHLGVRHNVMSSFLANSQTKKRQNKRKGGRGERSIHQPEGRKGPGNFISRQTQTESCLKGVAE